MDDPPMWKEINVFFDQVFANCKRLMTRIILKFYWNNNKTLAAFP